MIKDEKDVLYINDVSLRDGYNKEMCEANAVFSDTGGLRIIITHKYEDIEQARTQIINVKKGDWWMGQMGGSRRIVYMHVNFIMNFEIPEDIYSAIYKLGLYE